jgi:hypothetical protein
VPQASFEPGAEFRSCELTPEERRTRAIEAGVKKLRRRDGMVVRVIPDNLDSKRVSIQERKTPIQRDEVE